MDISRSKKRSGACGLAMGGAMVLTIASLLVWAATRETATEKLINQRLAELRTAGEPLDAAALAKMLPLPPPELDANILLKHAPAFAHAHRAPGITPIVMSGSVAGTQSIDATVMSVLRRHYEDSAEITNVMPLLPPGARFGEDWAQGVLNAKAAISFLGMRDTLQMLSARAIYAAEAGDAEGATAMIERSFQFARAIPADSSLVCHMIRKACIGLACTVAQRCLNRVQFSDSQLQRMLASMPSGTDDIVGTFRVEHCTTVWIFNEVRAGKRLDDIILGGTPRPWWKRAVNRLWRPRNEYNDEDLLAYLELIPRVLETAALPPRRAIDECRRLFTAYASNATCEVAQAAIPSWRNAIQTHHEVEAQLEATRAAVNVERYRLANGRLPESLAALAPVFTPSTPVDSFDGQPLRFKALSPGYTVYSIGADGVDHGGVAKTNAPSQTNYDITITVQRP